VGDFFANLKDFAKGSSADEFEEFKVIGSEGFSGRVAFVGDLEADFGGDGVG
jgi:hypothetical protein